MVRTSRSHPLQIAELNIGPHHGRVAITFCPGKKDALAQTGSWDRELDTDLDAIREWGAAAVLTLMEPHELRRLKVLQLGEGVRARHMDWLHLPIVDVSVPGPRFEAAWRTAGAGLRWRLRNGFNLLVHCRGGLGRAGMIAARLHAEILGDPPAAVRAVRAVRPGAIQTLAQETHVYTAAIDRAESDLSAKAIEDRAVGALLGLAVGDAVGTTLEFTPRTEGAPSLSDMVGGGPFKLKAGEWTDDTAMALALAESLLTARFDPRDLMERFLSWRHEGVYSCNGRCFDIGNTVSASLRRYAATGDPIAGVEDPWAAGNGSLMRLAPVAIRYWSQSTERRRIAALQSRTTHGALEAIEACIYFADLLAETIQGKDGRQALPIRPNAYKGQIGEIAAGRWRGQPRDYISGSGYVVHSLEAALWCVGRTASFRDAVLLAANLCEDADTTAAITGQLAGALYGASHIPEDWLAKLAWRDRIENTARRLFRMSQVPDETLQARSKDQSCKSQAKRRRAASRGDGPQG